MGLNLDYIDGQTPIDEDEKEGLIIQTITTKGELDEFEQQNIEEAMQWIFTKKFKAKDVFTEKFICNLHSRMYGNVWSWAGEFRKTNKNLGIDKFQIPIALRTLCDDALFWVENKTFSSAEIALRFKHRLVSIHCFSNGNGRHSRLMSDLIIEKIFGEEPFTWGEGILSQSSDSRRIYLEAVKAADLGDFRLLLDFARS
ncbi:mobile mystery protein B [Algoriphagus namhaensis]